MNPTVAEQHSMGGAGRQFFQMVGDDDRREGGYVVLKMYQGVQEPLAGGEIQAGAGSSRSSSRGRDINARAMEDPTPLPLREVVPQEIAALVHAHRGE
jgi:hypothetical protein